MTRPRRQPCRLADVGVLCALGRSLDELWPRLVAGDQSCFSWRDDLIPGQMEVAYDKKNKTVENPPI